MPSPTRLQVRTQVGGLLDDPNFTVFTDPVFSIGFGIAYDSLFQAAAQGQIPLDELVVNGIHLITGTSSFNPLANNILDMNEYIRIEERTWGSNEKFTSMNPWSEIPQRDPSSRLVDYVFRNNTFYFVNGGSTTDRELQIAYRSTGTAPTSDGTTIPWDGCLRFLALATAGICGPIKGYDELGRAYYAAAYGSKYDSDGKIGGELKRIMDDAIRGEQKTPLAIKPYSVYRSRLRRRVPYVAAQQPQGIGTGPAQFSTGNGTITGTLDGVNTQFFLAYPVATMNVYRNGIFMTIGVDCTAAGNVINFLAGQVPQAGDIISAEGWI